MNPEAGTQTPDNQKAPGDPRAFFSSPEIQVPAAVESEVDVFPGFGDVGDLSRVIRGVLDDVLIGTASVHATLALAASDIWSAISAGPPRRTRGAKAAGSTMDS